MNERALLAILRGVGCISSTLMFLCAGVFFGGFGYIIFDTYYGTGAGIIAGLLAGAVSGAIAVGIANALLSWLFPGR